ncbi:MAG: stage II sporulation protein M [Tissierellia bacterium]|nr:stage II sporulation protein M [Tissierellia bacterium]MDD4726166.1 stage II sporulation protein M [Tissierellia bacterium]
MNLTRYKKLLENHMENGFTFHFSLLLIFIFGVIIGSLMIKFFNVEVQESILNFSSAYFNNINRSGYSNFNLFQVCLLIRFAYVVIIYSIGLLNISILIPVLIFVQGGALGFNVAYIINNFGFKGFLISILGYFPQYVIFIPSFIILGALSMTMAIKYKMSANKSVLNIKRLSLFEYTTFHIIFSFIILIGTIYEGYISPIFLNMII